jgi:DoxX-like family
MTTAQAIAISTQFAARPDETNAPSRGRLWTGRILTGLSSAFLIFDATMKIVKPAPVLQASLRIGYPASALIGTGIVLFACTVLYLIRRTSVLGAVLLTVSRRRSRHQRSSRTARVQHHLSYPVRRNGMGRIGAS